jgi:uncharacterized protein (DUF433 family)
MAWIVSDANHLGGKPRVRDTRIAVALLLEWLAAGMTIEEIVKEYPSLTMEAVRGTLEELAHSELLAPSENPSRREHMPESLLGALEDLGHEVDSVNHLKLKGLDNGTLYRQVARPI